MSFAEILDTGFRLLRDHFVVLVGISASLQVPVIATRDVLFARAGGDPFAALPVLFGMVMVLTVVGPIVGIASTYAVGQVYLGQGATIGRAFREALRLLVPAMGTSLLAALVLLGATVLLILPGVWVWFGFMALSPVMAIERRFGGVGLSRSLELMKGRRLRAAGIVFVTYAAQFAITMGFDFAPSLVPGLGTIAEGALTSITGAYTAAVIVVFYFDARSRKEAFEIEQLARIVEAGAAPAAAA